MGKRVLVDPFDGVADLGADLGRCVDQSVDGDLNIGGLRPKARTSWFLDFVSACLAASMSIWPAV